MDPTKNNGGGYTQPPINDGTMPPQRPFNDGLQVPPRPQQNVVPPQRDIDESAFTPTDVPTAPPNLAAPPTQPMSQPYSPAPPAPSADTPPATWDKPQTPTLPPAQPVGSPQPIQPAPPATPSPSIPATPPTVAPSAPSAPVPAPNAPSQVSFSPESPQVDGFRPPAPTPQPPTSLQSVAAASTRSVEATYTPPTPHLPQDIAARIGETPQQNSSDIQHEIEEHKRVRHFRGFISFIVFLAGIFLAAFLINQFVFQSYYVDGTSMTPTLQNEDRLIIDKVERTFASVQGKQYIPERGQIVVLDSSIIGMNGQNEQLIKRVIGLPGDTVSINDGKVTIYNQQNPDGFDVDELLGLHFVPTYVTEPLEVTVGDNQLFVLGDNRAENGSYDSRAFGPVDASKIEGRLWARILPLNKARVFN